MRFYVCLTCNTCYQVSGQPGELASAWSMLEHQDLICCPTQKCAGHLRRVMGPVSHPKISNQEIPFPIFFRAVHGFGSPDGAAATLERFRELVTTKKVVSVVAYPVGQPERVILRRMVLEGGIVLHFDTSSKGACCYYIEEPGPSCLEVLDNEICAESADQNREEAGRDPEAGSPDGSEARDCSAAAPTAPADTESGGMPSVPAAGELPESCGPPDGGTRPG